jgi:hypothetical protein
MRTLPAERVSQWKYDGFLSPFSLLDEEELAACRQGVQRYEKWLGKPINAHPEMKWRSMAHLLICLRTIVSDFEMPVGRRS